MSSDEVPGWIEPPTEWPDSTEKTPPVEEAEESHEVFSEPVASEEPTSAAAPRPKKSSGGAGSVIGMMFSVVLGGVTVFGTYFFFLKDRLDPKPQPAKAPAEPEKAPNAAPVKITKREKPAPIPIPRRDTPKDPLPIIPKEAKPEPKPPKKENGEAAANALNLARKMEKTNPDAAVKWFQKVINQYPETSAAKDARDWLKEHGEEP